MPSLDDAKLKLCRGKVQLQEFYKHINGSLEGNQVVIKVYTKLYEKPAWIDDPRPWHFYTVFLDKLPTAKKSDGILLGDAIQSFKVALDYVAWAFAIKYSRRRGIKLSKEQKRGIYFPFSSSHSKFLSSHNHMIPNVRGDQLALFERYQPYRRVGRPLRILNVLANMDKHRLIIPVGMLMDAGDVKLHRDPSSQVIYSRFLLNYRRHIKPNTPVLTVCLAGSPPSEKKVHVDFKGSVFPVFPTSIIKRSPPRPYIPVEEAMNDIRDVCSKILSEAQNVF